MYGYRCEYCDGTVRPKKVEREAKTWMWAFVKFAAADITEQRFFTRFTM